MDVGAMVIDVNLVMVSKVEISGLDVLVQQPSSARLLL
jgi:hypothetical protein